MSARRTTRSLLAAGLAVVVLTGCGFRGAASIPLPGGEGQGDDAYKLTIEFSDVIDLVVQSAVKVDDVTVGSVESIEVDGFNAKVVVSVNPGVELPANTTASVRQTSLLGGLPIPPLGGGAAAPAKPGTAPAAPAPVVRDMTLGGILDGGR